MENKLGYYINNLMTTIIDKEERLFVRKLAFNELVSLNGNISEVLRNFDDEINNPIQNEKDKDQLELNFDTKHPWADNIDEERMDIIGQNGNDGLHYDKLNNNGEENVKNK